MTAMDDLLILQSYQRTGDPEAFRRLVERHQRLVFSAAQRVLIDNAWVEDTVQETFLRLAGLREAVHTSLGSWLHRVATRLAIDRLRSERSRQHREREAPPAPVEAAPGADDLDQQRRLLTRLDEAIDHLPEEDRALVVDHFLGNLPQSVLAERLGISRQAVQQRLQRLLEQLGPVRK